MKNNKKLVFIVGLLIVGIGVSFGYFMLVPIFEGTGSNTSFSSADLIKVEYDAGSGMLDGSGLFPGDTATKAFSVKVTPTSYENTAYYSIYLNITSNNFVLCSDTNYNSTTNDCEKGAEELIYVLKDNLGNVLASGDLTNSITGNITVINEVKTVDVETTYNYTLELQYLDTNKAQNHNINKTINASVEVKFRKKTLADEIIAASSTNSDIEVITHESDGLTDYRYVGSNPDNYICFGTSDKDTCLADTDTYLYRMIGVMPTQTTIGGSYEYRVKLIKDTSYGSYYWTGQTTSGGENYSSYNGNASNYNNWEESKLNRVVFNQTYLNELGNFADKIESTVWYLGGTNTDSIKTEAMYESERGTTVYSGNPTATVAKVGLMYPSDYGYAAGNACSSETNLSSYNTSCKSSDYLFKGQYEWLITPRSDVAYYAFAVASAGAVWHSNYVYHSQFAVRQSFYLKSSTSLLTRSEGTGKLNDPYLLDESDLADDESDPADENNSTLVDYIIDKFSTSSDMEVITHESDGLTDCRYVGANPDNYICFGTNNKDTCLADTDTYLYRIIGVIPTQTDVGGSYEYRVKLIKGTSHGEYYWTGQTTSGANNYSSYSGNPSNYNNWEESKLNKVVLNQTYLNELGDFADKIESTVWYLGGYSNDIASIKTEAMYEYERGTNVCSDLSCTKYVAPSPTKTVAKVGLMYPSDYGYAAGSACSNGTNLYNYGGVCKSSDYLFKGQYEWLITPRSDYASVAFYVYNTGYVPGIYVDSYQYAVRPSFYLKSSVSLKTNSEGAGTSSDPYMLS